MRWTPYAMSLSFVTLFADVALPHDLGFSSAELRFVDDRVQLELVLDAPDAETSTDAERRVALLARLQNAVTIAIDQVELPLTTRVVALGEGPSAVDVVEFRAPTPATLEELKVGFVAGLGDVALEVRAPSGRRVFRRLLADGVGTPAIALSPKPDVRAQDAGAGEAEEPRRPRELPLQPGASDVAVQSSSRSESSAKGWVWLAVATLGALLIGTWAFVRRARGK